MIKISGLKKVYKSEIGDVTAQDKVRDFINEKYKGSVIPVF